jgi:SPOR domain
VVEVQLATSPSEDAAQAIWQRLQDRVPDAAGREPSISKVELEGKSVWRLRTGGFASAGEASAFRTQLRGARVACATMR